MSRDISLLHPKLQEKAAWFSLACLKAGYKIGIAETVRTVEEQNALYAKGRTKPGSIVTNAKGTDYSSMHQWGVAFDIYRNDGKGAYFDSDGFFAAVGKIGQECGLEWGGAWTGFIDKPHFQLPDWGSTSARLKSIYKTPDAFKKTWNTTPDLSKNDIAALKAIANLPKYRVNAKSGLRLRKGPSLNDPVLLVMPFNSNFIGTGEKKKGFIYGEYNGTKGWASSEYLTKI